MGRTGLLTATCLALAVWGVAATVSPRPKSIKQVVGQGERVLRLLSQRDKAQGATEVRHGRSARRMRMRSD